jgi:cytochrome c nitrite reductase small subunit
MHIKSFFLKLKPPAGWILVVNFTLAVFIGLFLYAFYVSNAVSYLSDAPETCVNCHVMRSEYISWQHSAHREVAVCNDCHVPQDNIFSKYFFKAKDGLRHATIFTLRTEPQVIKMHEAGQRVVQANCQACHARVNREVGLTEYTLQDVQCDDEKLCWTCHREVPHGRVHGLSTTPNALVPLPGSPVPAWLESIIDKK